tara:strand:- start:379 stop:1470 length:1092 start_codon:yes stop_codon:yes gene_type:complete
MKYTDAKKLSPDKAQTDMNNDVQVLTQKSLLIPCYEAGMGSILRSLVAALLFAEITERRPFIYWNINCLYLNSNSDGQHNAFNDFFEDINSEKLNHLFRENDTVHPKNISLKNLNERLKDNHRSIQDLYSHDATSATLLIFPTYQPTRKILESIPAGHPLHQVSEEEIAKRIANKYLKVKPDIQMRVNAFWKEHFSGNTIVITVHIRGGDKYQEAIMPNFSRYKKKVDVFLKAHPDAKIFLASDSNAAVNFFKKCYNQRVITSQVTRSDNQTGIHVNQPDGLLAGTEILFDVECLSRGKHFIGFNQSNVFHWVCHLTETGQKKRFTYSNVQPGLKEILFSKNNFKRKYKTLRRYFFRKKKVVK